jgi:peptidoglycan-N-acetylglucosamine deacetylase
MSTLNPTLKIPVKHKQIFYDPSGNRWKLSILISSFVTVLAAIILIIGIPSGITIASIQDQGSKSKNESTVQLNTSKKNTAFFTTNTEKSLLSLKENSKNIKNLVLPWIEIKKSESKITVSHVQHPYFNLVNETIEKNNPEINKLLLLSDIAYAKPVYEDRYNGGTFQELIAKPELQDHFVTSLLETLKVGNYKGLVVEIQEESIGKRYEQYQQFLKKIFTALTEKKLSLEIKANVFDDIKLLEIDKQFASELILEMYQKAIFNKNPAASIDPNSFQSKTTIQPLQSNYEQLGKVTTALPELTYSVALPTQSVDVFLSNKTPGWHGQLTFDEVGQIIEKYKPDVKYDFASGFSTFEYTDNTNQDHRIIVNDATTVYNSIYNFNTLNQQPVSVNLENIGYEEPTIWLMIQAQNITTSQDILLNKLQFNIEVKAIGSGVINRLNKNPEFGTRQIVFEGDKILDTKITKLPSKALVSKTGFKKGYIALTFDDGPDPKYTPQILDVLKTNNVKASFFALGSNVIDYPELAQRISKEGHMLGNHTYNHTKLKNANEDQFHNEIESTQKAIAEIVSFMPKYFRTPYNDFGGYETNADLKPLRILDKLNLKVSESDLDSHDYDTQDLNQIIDFVKKGFDENKSSQVLFHDSGGFTRQSTVQALPEIIKFFKDKDYKFVTVEQLDKLSQNETVDALKTSNPTISGFSRLWFFQLIGKSDLLFRLLLFVATSLGVIRLLVLLIGLLKHFKGKSFANFSDKHFEFPPPVSVLIPCYNEEKVICSTIDSILNSDYNNLEVIVIDDCSTDNSLKLVQQKYRKNKRVKILTKPNGGKAEALNFGMKHSKYDFIVSMDADTLFAPDTVSRLIQHFADPKVGGVAGFVEVGNDYFYQKSQGQNINFNWLTTCQRLEYIFGQNFDKQAYDGLGCVIVVPGAIGAWRKQVVLDVGGYKTDTLAEDTDLTVRILRSGWNVEYCKDAFCVTEAPETLQQFWKQRIRWQFGTLQVIFKNLDIIFNPKHKAVSMFAIPYLFFNFFSMLVSPIANLPFFILLIKLYIGAKVGVLAFNLNDQVSMHWMFIFIFGYLGIEYVSTIFAIWQYKLKGKWVLLAFVPIQILVFRLLILVITVTSILKAFQGKAVGWGHLQRTGNAQKMKQITLA